MTVTSVSEKKSQTRVYRKISLTVFSVLQPLTGPVSNQKEVKWYSWVNEGQIYYSPSTAWLSAETILLAPIFFKFPTVGCLMVDSLSLVTLPSNSFHKWRLIDLTIWYSVIILPSLVWYKVKFVGHALKIKLTKDTTKLARWSLSCVRCLY